MGADADEPPSTKITLTYEDGRWVARDERTGTARSGPSRSDALAALDAAIENETDSIDPEDPFWDAEPVAAGTPTDVSGNVDEYLYDPDLTDE